MTFNFTKMHGIGNDFVVVDARNERWSPTTEDIIRLSDRSTGIGCDQFLSIEPATDGISLFRYGIWNADGSTPGQCGNGVRCVALWLYRSGSLELGRDAILQSPSGSVAVRAVDPCTISVNMGEPEFAPQLIPFKSESAGIHSLAVGGYALNVYPVSIGNPFAIVEVQNISDPIWKDLGPTLTKHPYFPLETNAGFVQIINQQHVKLLLHERGSGWTRACGTGACATVAALRSLNKVSSSVQVDLPGGSLFIDWHGPDTPLWMTGPANFVFEGALLTNDGSLEYDGQIKKRSGCFQLSCNNL